MNDGEIKIEKKKKQNREGDEGAKEDNGKVGRKENGRGRNRDREEKETRIPGMMGRRSRETR